MGWLVSHILSQPLFNCGAGPINLDCVVQRLRRLKRFWSELELRPECGKEGLVQFFCCCEVFLPLSAPRNQVPPLAVVGVRAAVGMTEFWAWREWLRRLCVGVTE